MWINTINALNNFLRIIYNESKKNIFIVLQKKQIWNVTHLHRVQNQKSRYMQWGAVVLSIITHGSLPVI